MIAKPLKAITPTHQSTTKITWNQSNQRVSSNQSRQANNQHLLPSEKITPSWKDDGVGNTKMYEDLTKLLFRKLVYPVGKGRLETIDQSIVFGECGRGG